MKKLKTIMAACAACALTSTAMAADGTINFTGEIVAASCTVTGGAGTEVNGTSIDVGLGKVSISSLTTAGAGVAVGGTLINLSLDCAAAGVTKVKFNFDPMSGSGIDASNNSLLKTDGVARGVGIGLFDESGQLINLSANQAYVADLTSAGPSKPGQFTAELRMRASYVANGADLEAGTATGTLPFSMTYE
ncbi:Fimbrial subunit type 1 precursor [compost metagenome]